MDLPNLIENQIDSFRRFVEKPTSVSKVRGLCLKDLLDDISPIVHTYGNNNENRIELYFGDYYFEEPKIPSWNANKEIFLTLDLLNAKYYSETQLRMKSRNMKSLCLISTG